VLLSTHGMLLAERLCDDICLISGGRVVVSGPLAEIKRRLGGNAYRLRARGDLERLAALPGVEHVAAQDGQIKLLLATGVSGPQLLRELVGFLEIEEFRSEEPDLEEIFLKAVRDADR
jgi:ABC-2 type transport system ATP-binding protein